MDRAAHGSDTGVEASDASERAFTLLWSQNIEVRAAGETTFAWGQIAARGSLIVVASRGEAGKNDDADGVHVLDGRLQAERRLLRVIRSPDRDSATPGAADAAGVALDGSFVVFGTRGGAIAKRRLDGAEIWTARLTQENARPGAPLLVDLNKDGVRDVVVPVVPDEARCGNEKCGEAWRTVAVALDGRTGAALWSARDDSLSFRRLPVGLGVAPVPKCDEVVVGLFSSRSRLLVRCARDSNHPALNVFDLGGNPADSISFGYSRAYGTPRSALHINVIGRDESGQLTAPRVIPHDELDLRLVEQFIRSDAQPVLGDIDGDGAWDLLVLQQGVLEAFTPSTRDASAPAFWRTHVLASSVSVLPEVPAAYQADVHPRDVARWLAPDRQPADGGVFTATSTGNMVEGVLEKIKEPERFGANASPSVATQRCGAELYGINEGSLVIREGDRWKLVSGAPWPVRALDCRASSPFAEQLYVESAAGAAFLLDAPLAWQSFAGFVLVLLIVGTGYTIYYTTYQHPLAPPPPPQPKTVRRVVVSDVPRSRVEEAHPTQARLLHGLLNALDNEDTKPPVTVALYGPWGSGKSSVMRILRSELQQTGRYIDVWFNAWRYQREKDLAAPLLQSIVDEVGRQTDWMTRVALVWARIRGASPGEIARVLGPVLAAALIVTIAARVSWGGVGQQIFNSAAFLSGVGVFFTTTQKLTGTLFKVFALQPAKLLSADDSKSRIEFVREFPREFERIARKLPKDTRLVVFIDDLDRCAPDRIAEVLETLSMLADTGCGIFVLAIDRTTVRRAVELKYKELLRVARRENPQEAHEFGARYLEKMITLGVQVPRLSAAEVSTDARLESEPVGRGLAPLLKQILPEPPLAITLLLLALLTVAGLRFSQHVGAALDVVSSAALTPSADGADAQVQAPQDAGVIEARAQAPAPGPEPTVNTPGPSPRPAPAPSTGQRPKTPPASVTTKPTTPFGPALAPIFVRDTTTRSPAHELRFSKLMLAAVLTFGALAGLAISLLLWSERRRQKKIRSARPMDSDSDEFTHELALCKRVLPENPRNVVRFTNTARFLYQVMAESERKPEVAWEHAFFQKLSTRWLQQAESSAPDWLDEELDQWLPRD